MECNVYQSIQARPKSAGHSWMAASPNSESESNCGLEINSIRLACQAPSVEKSQKQSNLFEIDPSHGETSWHQNHSKKVGLSNCTVVHCIMTYC